MTDTEATRIVAEAMGYEIDEFIIDEPGEVILRVFDSDGVCKGFAPTTNAHDEQLLREWSRENLTETERCRVNALINDAILDRGRRCLFNMLELNTGDLTRAIAQVLAERGGGDAT